MAPRFAPTGKDDVPFGAYDLDTGRKQSMESVSRDNRVFYASSFQSTVPRFGRSWSQPVQDVIYDVTTLSNSKPSTLSKAVETAPIRYSIHRSKQKRFSDKNTSEAPDIVYNLDCGNKETLYTTMKKSPIIYRNLALGTSRGEHQFSSDAYKAGLGPGAYDFPYHGDATKPAMLENRPLSSLVSQAERFPNKKTGMGLGSTYRPENDAKKWHASSQSISKAEYLRPQYMPKSYMRKQIEESAALQATAKK
eukprot:gene23662-9193_t